MAIERLSFATASPIGASDSPESGLTIPWSQRISSS